MCNYSLHYLVINKQNYIIISNQMYDIYSVKNPKSINLLNFHLDEDYMCLDVYEYACTILFIRALPHRTVIINIRVDVSRRMWLTSVCFFFNA